MAMGVGVVVLGACGGGGTSSLSSSATITVDSTEAATTATTAPTAAPATTVSASTATTTAGATPSADAPCTLLTAAQVQAAVGTPLKGAPRANPDPPDGATSCEFPTQDVMQQFTVDVFGADRFMPKTDDPKNIAVPGVGQAAVYESDWHRIQVKTAKGARFQVKFVIGDVDDEQAKITKLAGDVAAHL
jgi:hypothetical protein